MSFDKDFKHRVNYRRSPRHKRSIHKYLLPLPLIVGGISVIGVVLASTKSGDDNLKFSAGMELQRLVQHSVTLPQIDAHPQITDTGDAVSSNWATITVEPGDSASAIFSRLNIYSHLQPIMKNEVVAKAFSTIQPGHTFKILLEDKELTQLVYAPSKTQELIVTANKGTYSIEEKERAVEKRTSIATATISDSLFLDGKREGLSDNVIMQVFNAFAYDIDFALDIREGDKFSVIYEERFLEGERLGDGAILAAEFTNSNRTYRAIRHTTSEGESDYYDESGHSLKKAFIRTPVEFARISSHFNPRRMHPILQTIRAHKGVDYAAPTGTPVRATGAGTVTFKGTKGGYGKVIELQHGKNYSTLYGHLSAFSKGLADGQKVTQGQVIGYVGQTGRATGPHLHYEFRVNGEHKDPITVKLPNSEPLNAAELMRFRASASLLLAQLNAENQRMASR